ncbi:hypothetical protein BZL29_4014 [Mycobacterium kansasii]|uniref:Uncharacterized protein n=1 Tax=Mycobacterium kansasii TaxID=1768 RepID=A0A1V3XFM4_MYCKA|nr:hypothetical protein BZL29_4014 [Mycobacterium kansasii]
MTCNDSAELVRRILGISWPRRFLLAVFVVVGWSVRFGSPGCPVARTAVGPGPRQRRLDPHT